jgi:hypothetical protein
MTERDREVRERREKKRRKRRGRQQGHRQSPAAEWQGNARCGSSPSPSGVKFSRNTNDDDREDRRRVLCMLSRALLVLDESAALLCRPTETDWTGTQSTDRPPLQP